MTQRRRAVVVEFPNGVETKPTLQRRRRQSGVVAVTWQKRKRGPTESFPLLRG
jgi:hypothetical protein